MVEWEVFFLNFFTLLKLSARYQLLQGIFGLSTVFPTPKKQHKIWNSMKHRVFACFKFAVVKFPTFHIPGFCCFPRRLALSGTTSSAEEGAQKKHVDLVYILGGENGRERIGAGDTKNPLQNRERFGGANARFRLVQLYPRIVKWLCLQHTRLIILVRLIHVNSRDQVRCMVPILVQSWYQTEDPAVLGVFQLAEVRT